MSSHRPLTLERVATYDWQPAATRAVVAGGRAVSLYAVGDEVRLLLARGADNQLLGCAAQGEVETLLGIAPHLEWGEREAHDRSGIGFRGHSPLRPLVEHDLDLDHWTVPVTGQGPYQVAVGPIHAGVIESGHFRFHVVGERILHLDVRLFYKHRGLERAAEGQTLAAGMAHVQRMCAACAVTNTVAYAQACEQALGQWPDADLARARTVLLELERLYNHLYDIGQICAGVGFAPGNMIFLALKERAQRLNERLAGHRFLFGAVAIGASPVRIDANAADAARAELRSIEQTARSCWREVLFNGSVQDRLDGVGVVTHDWARRLGAVGPAARASGMGYDVRTESPRLDYEGFVPAVPERGVTGDVQARLDMRAAELWPTFAMLDTLLSHPIDGGSTTEVRGGRRCRRVPCGEPARRDRVRGRARRGSHHPPASAQRVQRQLARGRPRRDRRADPGLSAGQQEL